MQIGLIAASPFVLGTLERWAGDTGLALVEHSGLFVKLEGEITAIEKALGVRIEHLIDGWHTQDTPKLPAGTVAISGLSTKGQLHTHSRIIDGPMPILQTNGPRPGVTPSEVASAYQVSGSYDGTGQTIAIAAWGVSFQQSDIDAFCQQLGLPPCTPEVVSVNGYQNTFNAADGPETTLDICWAHAMAPGATIRVYMAPGGSDDAAWAVQVSDLLNTVLADSVVPAVLNISYGDGEDQFTASDLTGWDHLIQAITAKGTAVCVSSGDQGAYGLHVPEGPQIRRVDAPAACPHALAVGATALFVNGLTLEDEQGWSNDTNLGASGGGYSMTFARPTYQDRLSPMPTQRGVPDLAAIGSIDTPAFLIYDGQYYTVGGTSLSSPVVAGILTRIAQQAGRPLGDIHAVLYAHGSTLCRDITTGNNTCYAVSGYDCRRGWDEVTGWGSPLYPQWQAILAEGQVSAKTDPTTASPKAVDLHTLTVAQLANAPDGHYGAANIPLQDDARTVLAAEKAATLFGFSHHAVGWFDAAQRASVPLEQAGVQE